MDNEKIMCELAAKSPGYTPEAFQFVAETVTWMAEKMDTHRHLTAAELVGGVGDMAAEHYGALAKEVLNSFGVRRANDVGDIVYMLIDTGILCASPDDRREDFDIDMDVIPEKYAGAGEPFKFSKAFF